MWNCFKTIKALHTFQYFYLEWMIPLELLPVIKLRELRYNARLFLEEGMETYASILAWRILWTEEPGTVQSTGSQRVRLDWSDWAGTQDYLEDSAQLSPQLCPTLCDPMNRSTPGLPVHHQLPEITQTHVHQVRDAIQPSHPLSSPSPPAPNPSQHQSLFQWVNSTHEVAKILEFQL